jgi:hypothetical protein
MTNKEGLFLAGIASFNLVAGVAIGSMGSKPSEEGSRSQGVVTNRGNVPEIILGGKVYECNSKVLIEKTGQTGILCEPKPVVPNKR